MADRILNPFSSLGKPDSGSEQILQAKPGLDDAVDKAYKMYEGLNILYNVNDIDKTQEVIASLEEQVLTPSQIDTLLRIIKLEADSKKVYDQLTGIYLTRLIQDSYDAGHNDFVLITGDSWPDTINFIGYNLRGDEKRRLKLYVEGNANFLGYGGRYIEASISGYAGVCCGERAEHSEFMILHGADGWCGSHAKNSKFSIYRKVCKFSGGGADQTLFLAHNEQVYSTLEYYVQRHAQNKIFLIDSSGKIIKEGHP